MDHDARLLAQVTETLGREHAGLAEVAADSIFRELPSYRLVPRGDVLASVVLNTDRAIVTLTQDNAPEVAQIDESSTTTQARARQGVPIEDIIRAYRLSLNAIHDRFMELAESHGMRSEARLRGATLLWQLGDSFINGAVAEHQQAAVDSAVRASLARAELIRDLFAGTEDREALAARVRTAGADPDARHRVLVGAASGAGARRLEDFLDRRAKGSTLVSRVEDRLLGIVEQVPDGAGGLGLIAVSEPVALADVPDAAVIAQRIMEIVRGRPGGVHGVAEVSWRLAAAREDTVTQYLLRRCIEPVKPETEAGRLLLETLEAYLAANRRIAEAAADLVVHQNTLRYRLARYEELTGLDLRSTEVLVELAWALEARRSADL